MTLIIGNKMKNHGFTLLETLIVLAIMTMFFAVSIPLFSRFAESSKLDTSARSITSALRMTRGYAIANNSIPNYYLFFDSATNPGSYYVTSTNAATPANAIEKVYKLSPGISFGAINLTTTSGKPRACFKATGELVETYFGSPTITLTDTMSNTRTIEIEKTTGRARIQ